MSRLKYLLLFVFVTGVFSNPGFGQSTKNNDEEISRIVGRMLQYPGRTKDLDKLKENFSLAEKTDLDRIKVLMASGQPDIWYEIYQTYMKLDDRQKIIMKLPENKVQQSGIEFSDYQKNISESKYKATAFLYAHGEKLLGSADPEAARQAYVEFMQVAGMNNSYKSLDKDIRKAILKGATNMEFEMHNRSRKVVSSSMVDQLSIIIWEFKKARYGQVKPAQADDSFAFILRVILDDLEIGPDQVRELEYQEERDIIQDEQVVDTIKCLILETRQLKKAQLTGSLEYFDKQTGKVVNRVPIRVESVFSNAYATLQGDPGAAGEATRELLKAKKAAYPSNEQMILDATEEFAKKAGEIILAE